VECCGCNVGEEKTGRKEVEIGLGGKQDCADIGCAEWKLIRLQKRRKKGKSREHLNQNSVFTKPISTWTMISWRRRGMNVRAQALLNKGAERGTREING